jgi:NAD(P)-dependent dehydrogenase (short-subunit alcohol dehydrogenase family)
MKHISGSVAAVTGAGSGIGRAVALALAAKGARVAVTDARLEGAESTVAAIAGAGGEAVALAMDVAEPEQIRQALAEIQHRLGRPRLLVNNAGIAVGGYFLDTSPESWRKIMAINLMGVVHCCRAFLPVMIRAGGPGHVVNIASMLGYMGMRSVTAYSATKFGVMGFSESLRAEMRDYAIGVTAICPGMIRTNIISAGILESTEMDVEARRREINALYAKRNYPPSAETGLSCR